MNYSLVLGSTYLMNEMHASDRTIFFGVQADEVTDASNWEQLVIVVRYVKETKIVERCRLLTVNMEIAPFALGSGDWQVSVLRVVPLECN